MSFRFNFGNEESVEPDVSLDLVPLLPSRKLELPSASKPSLVMGECVRIGNNKILYRRCLADVKLDAAALDEEWIDQVMLENTDLINGVYEGGFKTWECSLDLANYLAEFPETDFQNKRVMELGCGSALPGLYTLSQGAHVDFQDYNELVLALVTIPNVLINTSSRPRPDDIDEKGVFEIEVDTHTVQQQQCGFYSGDWGSLNMAGTEQYDLILTSETLYSAESHQKLHDVLKRSLKRGGIVLIAAKRTYFGCSGDFLTFMMLVEREGVFKSEVIREFTQGVHRVIVQLVLN